MHCFPFQDWLTLRGTATGAIASITQTESSWLDVSPYQNVVAWLDVREVTSPSGGSLYIDFQTGPAKDENYFLSLVNQQGQSTSGVAMTSASSPTVQRFLQDGAYTPLSRWLRWKVSTNVSTTTAWDVTFRIWLAVSHAVR